MDFVEYNDEVIFDFKCIYKMTLEQIEKSSIDYLKNVFNFHNSDYKTFELSEINEMINTEIKVLNECISNNNEYCNKLIEEKWEVIEEKRLRHQRKRKSSLSDYYNPEADIEEYDWIVDKTDEETIMFKENIEKLELVLNILNK
jgi:hypothetical protein